MCSRSTEFPLLPLLLLALACAREDRPVNLPGSHLAASAVTLSEGLQAGPRTPEIDVVNPFDGNAWAVSEGQRLFHEMNCAGCHSPGGGGNFGPALNDSLWLYGSAPENIRETILEGRPNGMPTFRGRLTEAQIWQLVSYVRSLARLTPISVRSGRSDHTHGITPAPDDDRNPPIAERIPPEQQPPEP
ncbi:MAG TPA: c-type cytochrome [Gemmatimonadales bacterium]|nr:c-type cytochrome [Gemmatimonadales bacterium]